MNDGWVKLSDPNTGKEFFANKFTRQTQWEPPPGFVDPEVAAAAAAANVSLHQTQTQSQSHNQSYSHNMNMGGNSNSNSNSNSNINDLPPNWERMLDKASGKYFYVDHSTQKTSWEHPGRGVGGGAANGNGNGNQVQQAAARGTATGFGFIPESSSTSASTSASASASTRNVPSNSYNRNVGRTSATAPTSSSSSSWGNNHNHEYSFKPSFSSYNFSNTLDDQSSKYYCSPTPNHPHAMPNLEFKVVKVPDRLRPCCPSPTCATKRTNANGNNTNTGTIFSLSKRRHHCRLCGDIFCDACSTHRTLLPLGGPEFEKPVRVCDECHVDVDKGNYFSMRRYLTPLLLFDGNSSSSAAVFSSTSTSTTNDDGSLVESISATNVAAALTSLAQDLQSCLSEFDSDSNTCMRTSFEEKVTIGANVLVPAICRHLGNEETSDRAIRALCCLLALGNVVGDHSFACALYLHEQEQEHANGNATDEFGDGDGDGNRHASGIFDSILNLLEWSGTSVKTLAVQEQAAKVIFYLTDNDVMNGIFEMEEVNGHFQHEGWMNSAVMLCDVPRVLRSMLDHTTQSASPSLQRWAAACIRNLISEDKRRACEAVSEAMSMGMSELRYSSFMVELVSSGGVMILSSLVASDDADTRAHAMAALAQIIDASRELNVRLEVFIEAYQVQNIQTCSETAIVEAVVSSGACGPSLAQLLLSADDSSAAMACNFARSLVYPILSNPLGSSVPRYHRLFSTSTKLSVDDDGLKEYRQAALDIGASDGVLSALVHLVNGNDSRMRTRPVELRKSAMEILAAVTLTLSYWDSKIKNCGKSIETMDESVLQLQEKTSMALMTLEEERTGEVVLAAFSSSSMGSLNTSRDSATSQLKEAAALTISALASCSTIIANSFISSNILTSLIALASDDGFNSASSRGTWASRRLPMLEAIASILVQGWKTIQSEGADKTLDNSNRLNQHLSVQGSSKSVEMLIETLDAGIVPLISRMLNSNQEFTPSERVYADTRTRIAVCHCVSAMFGIGRGDSTSLGFSRIFEAMGNHHRIIPQILFLLGSVVPEAQKNASQGRSIEKDIPLLQLLEANLLAAGSICGADFCSFGSMDIHGDYAVSGVSHVSRNFNGKISCPACSLYLF